MNTDTYEVFVETATYPLEKVYGCDNDRKATWMFNGAVADYTTVIVELRRNGRLQQRANKRISE